MLQRLIKKQELGASLVVHWSRLRLPAQGGTGLIPGWGAKIPHAWKSNKTKHNTREHKPETIL